MNYFIIAIILIVLAIVIAWQKGYSSSLWFLAAGPLGLLVLIFALPDIKKISDPEEKIRKTNRGNRIGVFLSMLSLFAIAINVVSQTNSSSTYTSDSLGSFFWLVILTGFVSAGMASHLSTYKNRFAEFLGCLGYLISLVFLLVIFAVIAVSIYTSLMQS